MKQLRKQVGFGFTWTTHVLICEKPGEVHVLNVSTYFPRGTSLIIC